MVLRHAFDVLKVAALSPLLQRSLKKTGELSSQPKSRLDRVSLNIYCPTAYERAEVYRVTRATHLPSVMPTRFPK